MNTMNTSENNSSDSQLPPRDVHGEKPEPPRRDNFHDSDQYEAAYENYLRALEWWEKSFGSHDA
jgi:hypothetical protein